MLLAFKATGGSEGQFLMLSLYQRASSHEYAAFYGIKKARSVDEIRHFKCREKGYFHS